MKMETEVITPLEFNISEPLIDASPISIDKKVILNDAPINPVMSVCNEYKPLILVSYLPSSFGQVVCGLQKIN